MSVIHGTYRDGKIILDSPPADWPEGTEVVVKLSDPVVGELPDDEDVSPDAIARRLALMEQVEPWMTPEQDAAWRQQREKDKAEQLAMWEKWNRDIGDLFK